MFGSRLKTWMENYIGRPRKKDAQKEKSKGSGEGGGVILESSESLACSDAGISSGSQQVLSSSASDNREGYSTTTMESERSGMTYCLTTASLPSPESAYSTGYSTDGASPGGTGPPEYYINIRTGKHYFPSPAPTPTSPAPQSTFFQHPSVSFLPENSTPSTNSTGLPQTEFSKSPVLTFACSPDVFRPRLDGSATDLRVSAHVKNTLSASVPSYFDILNFSKSPSKRPQLAAMKLFLKSPKLEKGKPKVEKSPALGNKKKPVMTGKSKKWFKQPFQKFGHRRTDSCDDNIPKNETKKEINFDGFRYRLSQESSASPRQRNRIKTNPWLPTEPLSSQNFHNLNIDFFSSLTRNRSCSNTPLQNRKMDKLDSLQSCAKQSKEKREESQNLPNERERAVNRFSGGKIRVESSDHSDEDLTLNEMMGTYNESYVYEKETDILSDSDPTDCEDYGTDSEAENGGDERDSHDDELDFIDNGSIIESDDNCSQNTGGCTYHDVCVKRSSFLLKIDRRLLRKDSQCRRSFKKEQDSKSKREKRRQTRKSFKHEDKEGKKAFEEKNKPKVEIDENVGGLNLSRVLVQRLMQRSGPKSAEGTPVGGRKQKSTKELRVEKENAGDGKPRLSQDFALTDFEADKRYNELIKEAESMIESLRNSPVVIERKKMLGSELSEGIFCARRKAESVDVSTKAKPTNFLESGPKETEISAGRSPKNLGLKLSTETPKKFKQLDFGTSDQSSFKARSSAHSPLDPLGPAFRNFSVFDPAARGGRKVSTSSSEDSELGKTCDAKDQKGKRSAIPETAVVPIAFQSVDLGKVLPHYCPQSEPVKRKIYSCSKTYDKLVKRFENKPIIFEESRNGKAESATLAPRNPRESTACRGPDTCLDGNQGFSQKDRRKSREGVPRVGIARRPSLGPERSVAPEKPKRRSFDSDIFR